MDAAKVETVVTSAMISRFILAIAAVLVVDALCSTPIAEELVVISAVLVVVVAFRAVIAFEVVVAALCNTPIADQLLVVIVLRLPSVVSFAVTRVSIPVVLVSPVASPDCSAVINAF
jgi:hypothetical protein